MRFRALTRTALVAVALLIVSASANGQEPFSRRDPITEAIAKNEPSVVAIRVPGTEMVGTGFIVDETGYIITNAHVTAGKKLLDVRLHDGTDIKGKVVVNDTSIDLAIIRIIAGKHKLKALPLAPTSDLIKGERVIVLGNPFGYDQTATDGRLSGLNREIEISNEIIIKGVLQITAPINPGNSGGPLLNINGEVIGVVFALRDKAQNIAFAINASTVKGFLKKHLNAQKMAGIDHGVNFEEKIVAETGDRQRVVVKTADHVELQAGDEIRTIANQKVSNAFDLERSLWNTKPGEKVAVTVVRQGREVSVTVTMSANVGAGQVAAVSK